MAFIPRYGRARRFSLLQFFRSEADLSTEVTDSMEDLRTAVEKHQAGDLAEAARLYRNILAQEPDHADALHLLGVLHHQQGDHARGVELMGRAMAVSPAFPPSITIWRKPIVRLGQYERAAGCCRMALQLLPDYPEALCNLGLALQGLGRTGGSR